MTATVTFQVSVAANILKYVNQWAVETADIFRGLQLSHFYILHFLLLQSQPALTGSVARTLMSPRHWPELGERPRPISSATRQYQRPVGEGRWDWMASSGVEGGGEGRQNERLNLISSLSKMSHQRADYCTTLRTVGTDTLNKCPKSQRN